MDVPDDEAFPNAAAIAARVLALIAAKAGIDADALDAATSLESLGIDSLDMAELVFELEEAFDIQIPDTADIAVRFRGLSTVGSAVELVRGLIGQGPPGASTEGRPTASPEAKSDGSPEATVEASPEA